MRKVMSQYLWEESPVTDHVTPENGIISAVNCVLSSRQKSEWGGGASELVANSAGWPGRPKGVGPPTFSSLSMLAPPLTCNGVQIGPGATPLTRMPFLPSCLAKDLT